MTATEEPQARRGGFHFTCCVCSAKVHASEYRRSGWRGSRLGAASPGSTGMRYWCPAHVPADLGPPKPSRFTGEEDRKPLRDEPLGPRRRMTVYARETVKKRLLVFAFGLPDIAAAAGCSEAFARRELRTQAFDPLDLVDILRWIRERPAHKPEAPRRGRLVAELGAQLGEGRVSASAGAVAVDGLTFQAARAEELLEALRGRGRKSLINALAVLAGYRNTATRKRRAARKGAAKVKARTLRKIAARPVTAAGSEPASPARA
jgi:hypothetical protein